MSGLELVYDFFEDHVRASAAINERKPLAFGALCVAIGALSLFVAQALTQRLNVLAFAWPSLALAMLWRLGTAFLLVSLVHLILDMQGRYGSPSALFVHFGLADLAWALALPLALCVRALTGSGLAISAVFLAVGLLTFSLKARGLQDVYRISAGRAWVVLGMPYLAVLLGAVLAFSLALAGLVSQLVKSIG